MTPAKPIIEAPFLNYFMIASDAYMRMEDYTKKDGIEWPPFGKFHESAIGQATVVLIFAIMTLESFINNYASRKKVKINLKGMGLHKKWTIIPERATGRILPDDDRGMQMLRDMIEMRNSLIHTKSSQIEWEDMHSIRQRTDRINQWEIKLIDIGRGAFDCIGLLGQRLLSVDPEEPFAIMFSRLANRQTV